MGDLDIDIDVDEQSIERVTRALRKGVREGAYKSAQWAADEYESTAKDQIRGRRVWNREVYHGFRKNAQRRPKGAWASVTNPVPHAGIVNYGRRPGARAPQVQHIIEWVDDKVFAEMMADGGHPLNDRNDDVRDHSVTRRDTDIADVTPLLDSDENVTQGANSQHTYRVEFENGDRAIFKARAGINGSLSNEEFVSRFAEKMGWSADEKSGIPAVRRWSVEVPDGDGGTEIRDGIMMEFVPGGDVNEVIHGYGDEGYLSQSEFMQQNRETLARKGVIDYIVNNDDRHTGNIRVDFDEDAWLIDSGGETPPEMDDDLKRRNRLWGGYFLKSPDHQDFNDEYIVEDPDAWRDEMHAIFDRMEEMFLELYQDDDLREELAETAEFLHGPDSEWKGHYYALLLDPDSEFYIFEDGVHRDQHLWQQDITTARNRYEQAYQHRLDQEARDWAPDQVGEVSSTSDLEDASQDVLGQIEDDLDELLPEPDELEDME